MKLNKPRHLCVKKKNKVDCLGFYISLIIKSYGKLKMKLVSYRDEYLFQGLIKPYDSHLKGENDLSSRPVWSADRVPEQPGRHRETLGCGGYECLLYDKTSLARGDT